MPEIAAGEKCKARDILIAIHTLKTIERESRPPTPAERQSLSRFAGFGPVARSIFADPATGQYRDEGWQLLGKELRSLLMPSEYASAKRTTFNAFYTSPAVIRGMHAALARLGVPAEATILEPGCGIGNFMSCAQPGTRFVGVELDEISGRIAKVLHPEHDIRIESFQETRLISDSIDAVIGNVPFSNLKLDHHGQKFSLHDYFFAKSVDLLRPGGVLALVTSRFTLDKQNALIREYLAERADFVGAIRLPSNAFQREGTSVVTDIVFLRRRADGETPQHVDPDWLGIGLLRVEETEVAVNRYFLNHPEMVLGNLSRHDTLYGEGYSVASNGDLAVQLAQAMETLPRFAPQTAALKLARPPPTAALPPSERHIGEGSFVVGEDRIVYQIQEGQSVPVVYGGVTLRSDGTLTGKRLAALVRIRDLARRVLTSQNDGRPEPERVSARRELGSAYDRFIMVYGPINKTTFSKTSLGTLIRRMPNLAKFREDPDAMLVMSLEDYDEATGQAGKAAILLRDVVGRIPPVTQVHSAEEGLLVSLNERGQVDLPYISALYGRPEPQVLDELGELIFCDPQSQCWQPADAYLSGNVRSKLVAAEQAGAAYARNVIALREVQPEDVLPGDIDANLGAPWIPVEDMQAFAAELFHVDASAVPVGYLQKDAVWSLDAGYAARVSVAATSDYGTSRISGTTLLELALNMKSPTVYDTIQTGEREERVVNQDATLAAREKQKLIKEHFRSWTFSDAERTERLVRVYNDRYNNLRPRSFDGSHLSYPGMNETIRLKPHQGDAVWRGMSGGNCLLAHVVGAGKTFTMAATGMKMRQTGLIQKPMYVVPNHLLEQFAREFLQLYPNARLLVAANEDLARERRKFLTARIASGEWDGIIVTHSSFERIGMSRDFQAEFFRRQIAEYDDLLCNHAAANGSGRNLIKTIEKQKAERVERLKDLMAEEKKDDGLVFDELGVDHLFIDEAQYFKNLETPSKMERVAGIQTGGSERAFDIFMKARYLDERHAGHGLTFATGTPISNTMVELYTLQRFLDPAGLVSRGIEHFDAWAATFGEVVETMEISPDGASLRPRSRFARFTNLPELQQMFRSFADVQTAAMLHLPTPRLQTRKPQVVSCPMSQEQKDLQSKLVARYERLRSQRVDPREDNALNITTDGRKLATDARLLTAAASGSPESKINRLVSNVHDIWRNTTATRGAQLIFADLGVHPTAWDYSVYHEIMQKLANSGIPPEQIAAIGEADTDAKKQALFKRVRSGAVRILLGSTQKMGTGTNVQQRLVALHHLDAPWKPAEVEQRDGRILRQGNEHEEVAIYRYVTEGSFDAYMWQALETKARFITQVMTGDNTIRRAEDIGGQELSYAEVKAIASGNPAVLILAEADAELQRLALLKRNHMDEQFMARRNVRSLPGVVAELSLRLANLTADEQTLAAHATDSMEIGGRHYPLNDIVPILGEKLDALPGQVDEPTSFTLGSFRGLKFGVLLDPQFPPHLFLHGQTVSRVRLARDAQGPRAVLNALARLAGEYHAEVAGVRTELSVKQSQLSDYELRLGQPFARDQYFHELTEVRDQLKSKLAASGQEHDEERERSIHDLSERIKALQMQRKTAGPRPTGESAAECIGTRTSASHETSGSRMDAFNSAARVSADAAIAESAAPDESLVIAEHAQSFPQGHVSQDSGTPAHHAGTGKRPMQRSLFDQNASLLSPSALVNLSLDGQKLIGEVLQVDLPAGTADLCVSPTMEMITVDLETLCVPRSKNQSMPWTPTPVRELTLFNEGDAVEFERDGSEHYGEVVAVDDALNEATVMLIPSEEYVVCCQDRLRKVIPDPLDDDLARSGMIPQEKEAGWSGSRDADSDLNASLVSSPVEPLQRPVPRDESPPPVQPVLYFRDLQQYAKRLDEGEVSLDEHQSTYGRFLQSREAFIADLLQTTNAADLGEIAAKFGCPHPSRNTKVRNAEYIYADISHRFNARQTVEHDPLVESFVDQVLQNLNEMIEEDWQEHEAEEESSAVHVRRNARSVVFPGPHDSAESDRQRRAEAPAGERGPALDNLSPEESLIRIRAACGAGVDVTVKKGWHSKRHCELWIVPLSDRFDPVTFQALCREARTLDGWYSSVCQEQAGFQFLDQERAERFRSQIMGDFKRQADELAVPGVSPTPHPD